MFEKLFVVNLSNLLSPSSTIFTEFFEKIFWEGSYVQSTSIVIFVVRGNFSNKFVERILLVALE